MAVSNYNELNAHRGHKVQVYGYYTESVSIECADCYEILVSFENEEEEQDSDACEPADLPCVNGFSCKKHEKNIDELVEYIKEITNG